METNWSDQKHVELNERMSTVLSNTERETEITAFTLKMHVWIFAFYRFVVFLKEESDKHGG